MQTFYKNNVDSYYHAVIWYILTCVVDKYKMIQKFLPKQCACIFYSMYFIADSRRDGGQSAQV